MLIKLATISPADICYDETLSTLRFAHRMKEIKTNPIINETYTDQLIRKLREENAKLQKMIHVSEDIDLMRISHAVNKANFCAFKLNF